MVAPQASIPIASNVLSTIGTVFWCVQLIPQVWYNWKHKKTEGLPGSMMLLWAACAVPFGVSTLHTIINFLIFLTAVQVYAIIQNFAIPIQIQPQIFGILALIIWGQTLFYHDSWKTPTVLVTVIFCALVFAGVEVTLILTLRKPYSDGVMWPIIVVGVVAAVLLAGGLLPPYLEIWGRKGRVVGISWIFLSIDWLGALLSLLAIVTQQTFDVLGGVLYIIVIVLEGGIFLSHGFWLLRTKDLHQQAASAGVDFDELPEARKYQKS